MEAIRDDFRIHFAKRAKASPTQADAACRRVRSASLITLAVGMVITGGAAWASWSSTQRDANTRFNALADRLATEVQRRATLPAYGLKGARGAYAASKSIERGEFRAYVTQPDLTREFPGVFAFGVIARVPRSKLDSFVAAQRADGAPDFAVRTTDHAGDLYVVKFTEPLESNRVAWGWDAGSEPAQREAIESAIRSGEPTISEPIDLFSNRGRGYLFLVPMYVRDMPIATPEQRVAALEGVLYAPVSIEEAFSSISKWSGNYASLRVYDDGTAGTGNPGKQLYGAADDRSSLAAALYHRDINIPVAGRTWRLSIAATPRFLASVGTSSPILVVFGGMLVSVALSSTIWSLGRGRSQALWLAREMTTDLALAKDRAEAALREAEALRHTIDEHALVSVTDGEGRITEVNEEFCRVSGYDRSELIGSDHRLLSSGHHSPAFWADMWKTILAGEAWRGEVCNRAKSGALFWLNGIVAPFRAADGHLEKFVAIHTDVTEVKSLRQSMEDELRAAAHTDKLTGLPNRGWLTERLDRLVQRSRNEPDFRFAVLFLDFDRFKVVNDSLGHDVGDLLLKEISQRLRSCIRPSDSFVHSANAPAAARLGGDEFVVLLEGIKDVSNATLVADRLVEAFAKPYRLGKHEVFSTASIGVVTSDVARGNAVEVLRDADAAMYEAKVTGKGRHVTFNESMRDRVQDRINLENDLRRAIDQGQLFLEYQPIVCLQTGRLESFEALVRWQHPERGAVPPIDFIPLAEDTGLIIPLGEWVLREACAAFARFRERMGDAAPLGISVNLSRKQLVLPDLPDTIRGILDEAGIEPAALHLEVTESAIMRDVAAATRMLHAIKAIGVQLDMDDFGTGHSSLACLHQFPIDVLKIDRSFVANAQRGRDFSAIVQAVVQLAFNLDIDVIAEGIETPDQLLILQSLNCSQGQGFFFARPMPEHQAAMYRSLATALPGIAA